MHQPALTEHHVTFLLKGSYPKTVTAKPENATVCDGYERGIGEMIRKTKPH